MSRINGEKARANVAKKARNLRRVKDRAARAAAGSAPAAAPKKKSSAPRS